TPELAATEETSAPRPTAFPDLPPATRGIIELRWQSIEPFTKLGRRPTAEEFQARADELAHLGQRLSVRSLRRYWKIWHRSGGDRLALAPALSRCGRRGRGRRSSFLSRQPALRNLVDEAISNVFLSTARRPVSAVARRVLEDVERHNARLPAAQAVPIPRAAALERAIGRRIAQ